MPTPSKPPNVDALLAAVQEEEDRRRHAQKTFLRFAWVKIAALTLAFISLHLHSPAVWLFLFSDMLQNHWKACTNLLTGR